MLDPAKRKQLKKGLDQLSEEGAVQVFHDADRLERDPVLGAVGVLQFEVIQHRLRSEYGAEISYVAPAVHARALGRGRRLRPRALRRPAERRVPRGPRGPAARPLPEPVAPRTRRAGEPERYASSRPSSRPDARKPRRRCPEGSSGRPPRPPLRRVSALALRERVPPTAAGRVHPVDAPARAVSRRARDDARGAAPAGRRRSGRSRRPRGAARVGVEGPRAASRSFLSTSKESRRSRGRKRKRKIS